MFMIVTISTVCAKTLSSYIKKELYISRVNPPKSYTVIFPLELFGFSFRFYIFSENSFFPSDNPITSEKRSTKWVLKSWIRTFGHSSKEVYINTPYPSYPQ